MQVNTSDENLSAMDFGRIGTWAAYFGDYVFAMEALNKSISIDGAMINGIWFPVMKEVRQLPRFKELVREIGLIDYWKEYGWPDLCHPVADDDFVCD